MSCDVAYQSNINIDHINNDDDDDDDGHNNNNDDDGIL